MKAESPGRGLSLGQIYKVWLKNYKQHWWHDIMTKPLEEFNEHQEIPSTWSWACFDDVVTTLSTSKIKIKQKNYLDNGSYPIVDQGQTKVAGYTNNHTYLLECESPLIVFGDHTRCWKFITFRFAPGADGVKVLKSASNLDSRYLFFAFKNLKLQDRGYSRHFSILRKFRLPIAPLAEQKRIIDKIERLFSYLDEGERLLEQVQKQITTYRQAVLKAAVTGELTKEWRAANCDKVESGKELLQRILEERRKNWQGRGKYEEPVAPDTRGLPELPAGWLYVSLAHLIDGIEAGKSFRCLERPPNEDEIGVAKVSAVSWGSYNEQESKTCLDPKKINSAYFIKKGDLLISRANTIDLVGASVLVKSVSRNIMLSDKTLRLCGLHYSPEYLLLVLRSTLVREQIKKLSTGNQESMRNISQGSLFSLAVPAPSLQETKAIEERAYNLLDAAEHLSKKVEQQIAMLEKLRRAILASAFSGQLVEQDPNDVPASELLAHIQKEPKQPKEPNPRNSRTSKRSLSV
jgi:type I restriction enzyme, S subunit